MKTCGRLLCLFTLALLLSGCATTGDMMELQKTTEALRKDIQTFRQNQVEFGTQMGELLSKLDENRERTQRLAEQLEQLEGGLGKRLTILSEQLGGPADKGALASPMELFRLAQRDLNAGKYDLASVGFRQYLDRYPQSAQASEAQLNLGEIQVIKGYNEAAASEYLKTAKNYPKSAAAPVALYKAALSYQALNRREDALKALKELAETYPSYPELSKAKELQNSLQSAR